MYRKAALLLILILASLGLYLACAKPNVVIFAFDKDFPPFSFVEDGRFTGFDLEVLTAVLARKGLHIVIRPLSWQEALKQLERGEVNVVSAMDKTVERLERYTFPATAYIEYRLNLFVGRNSRIRSVADLKHKRVATQKSTTYSDYLRGIDGVNIHLYETELEAIEALKKGKVDAYVGAFEVAAYYLKKTGWDGLRVINPPLQVTSMYFAVKKGDERLANYIDEGLAEIKQRGIYGRIYKRWFY
ncbi:MAG: transporter substrate-binding domain-containing protein [Candidatus Saganbacteria bacterium]|nr:transporter substrate-binding domain-containing protein [Candidatus Saganbacteria bacterium]